MKKLLFVMCAAAALAFAGCNKGGTSDQYNSGGGSMTNAPSTSTTEQNAPTAPSSPGGATTPSDTSIGSDTNKTNSAANTP